MRVLRVVKDGNQVSKVFSTNQTGVECLRELLFKKLK